LRHCFYFDNTFSKQNLLLYFFHVGYRNTTKQLYLQGNVLNVEFSPMLLVNRLQESCPNERSTFIQAPIILKLSSKSVLLVESIRIIRVNSFQFVTSPYIFSSYPHNLERTPYTFLIFVLSNKEKAGRFAGVGYSDDGPFTRQSNLPISCMANTNSYQLISPSLEIINTRMPLTMCDDSHDGGLNQPHKLENQFDHSRHSNCLFLQQSRHRFTKLTKQTQEVLMITASGFASKQANSLFSTTIYINRLRFSFLSQCNRWRSIKNIIGRNMD
jgi:hypothetical protein